MKKTYIKPAILVGEIEMEGLLCQSAVGYSNDKPALHFDDEEEEVL